MNTNPRKKRISILLPVLLCLGLIAGVTFGKYVGEWAHGFGLFISPTEQSDPSLPRYFRSNELLPVSQTATYTVNGTEGWFTVANALDSSTVSQDTINYTLTWYVSVDGIEWTEYKTESGSFVANEYKVTKYTVEPVTISETVYNNVKVHGSTSSFSQEDIEAVYTFNYSDYSVATTYSDGVITVRIDTNDFPGDYLFTWVSGISPDNSDPNLVFTDAPAGPSEKTVDLGKNTVYEFLFFVTDSSLLEAPFDPTALVSVSKK